MISRKILIPVIVVIAIIPIVVLLLLSQARFTLVQNNVLLNQTATLTSLSYEREYYLSLKQGDRLSIQVSVTGEPIDFQVARDPPFQLLIDGTDILSFNEEVTIPSDGTYIFYIGTMGNHATVHIFITRV